MVDKFIHIGDNNPVKATKIFSVDRLVETDSGLICRLRMDLFDVEPRRSKGLFLDRFRFSWIFFEIENPARRVLVDCHPPLGAHVHFDEGPQQPIEAETLDEVRNFFVAAIKKRFDVDVEV